MVDRYTKTVLTVIAAALVAIVIREVVPKAIAQSGMDCGGVTNPCYVDTVYPLRVRVEP
jgi:hypothetical protein